MKRTVLAALVLPFLASPAHAGGGCATEGASAPVATTTVSIDHACFGTGAATVAVGATLTWRNVSGLDHNISGPGIDFAELPAGATFKHTFTSAGLYPYACMLHPGMSGVVVVGAVPSVAPAAAVMPVRPSGDGGTSPALWVALVAVFAALPWGVRRLVRGSRTGEVMTRWSATARTARGSTTH